MAVNLSKQFKLKIYKKKFEIIVINLSNVNQCTKMINNALESGLLVKLDNDEIKYLKQHSMIIQLISFRLIINSKIEGYFPLPFMSIDKMLRKGIDYHISLVDIQNINVSFKLIWQNPLILREWMNNKIKWRILFLFLIQLLKRYKISFAKQHIDLILTIMNTNFHWKKRHLIWLVHIDFPELFMKFLKHISITMVSRNNKNKQLLTTLSITLLNASKIYYMYHKQNHYQSCLKLWLQPIKLIHQQCKEHDCGNKKCREKYSYFNETIDHFFKNLMKFILYFERSNASIDVITMAQKYRVLSSKYKVFSQTKFCANIECESKNNYQILKICKQCKIVYYCSKHCQKIHWKNIHSKQCEKLSDKLSDSVLYD